MAFTIGIQLDSLEVKAAPAVKKYVVATKNSKSCENIAEKYDEKVKPAEDILENNDIITMKLTSTEAEQIENEKGVLFVEEDIQFFGCGNDIKAEDISQWNLEAINLQSAQMGDAKIKIALLDSGVAYTEDIDVKERVCFVPGEEEVNVLFEDGSGHGTSMAGMIAAKDNGFGITGIAPQADLYSLRVLDNDNSCTLSQLLSAIYWAIDNNIDIMNMSLGTSVDSDILHQAVADAYRQGCLVVAAAGNENASDILYPAAYAEVLSVGATNASGDLVGDYPSGDNLDVLAPGKNVPSTGLLDGVVILDGTSISTAQVTGAAAILWSQDRTKSPDFIKNLIKNTAKSAGTSQACNAGLMDVGYALEMYNMFEESYVEDSPVETIINPGSSENFTDEIQVSGMWAGGEHSALAGSIAANISSNSKDIELIQLATQKPDIDYADKKALHGLSNYVANIRYLFYMAKNVKSGSSVNAANEAAIAQLSSVANITSATDRERLEQLQTCTVELLNTDILKGYGEKGELQRYCKVLGFAMHLIGDTYAHRTIVPSYTVDGTNPTEPVYSSSDTAHSCRFGTTHFIATGSHTKASDATLKSWAKNSSDEPICKYWNCFQRTVKLGVMEFRDIKYYMESNKAGTYEDKITFCHERYADTKRGCTTFMNRSYSDKDTFTYKIFWSQYGNVLNYYKGYATEAGGKVGNNTDAEWNTVSTPGKY